MSSSSAHYADQTRTYDRKNSVVFLKTDAPFGGLSNMAGGLPLRVNGIRIHTSEALYQACRFPHRPDVQKLIIEQKSPMTAKMKSKPYRHDSRPDWDQVRVKIMRWCLRVKLAQNWRAFSELLLETGERPIVEESRKDAFWGAKATDDETLVGMNVLGRLLMELREAVRVEGRESLMSVQPLAIPDFLLGGRPIEIVTSEVPERDVESGTVAVAPARGETQRPTVKQPSLFDAPAVKEAPPAPYAPVRAKGVHVADLKPYSEYKASSQAWLGEVPRHWSLLPNRALFAEVKDRDHPDEEMLSVTITRGIVKQKALLEGSSKKDSSNLDKSAYKLVQPRDIAYNKMRAWQGAIGASALRGIISPAYVVMRLRNADDLPSYFHHLYRTPQFAKEAERWSYGITSDMWSLRPEHFKMIYTPEPPRDEQTAIVRFLDWANGRLERAIRAKQKVIALLNEQKQAIIHRAVTRGLDSSIPLKPSGIPWLGDIPQHWEVRRIKYLLREIDERSTAGSEPLLSMRMHHGLVLFADHFTRPPQAATLVGFKIVRPGQFVVNRMQAGNGVIFASTLTGLVSPDYAVFDPIGDANVDFLGELFRSRNVRMKFRAESKGLGTGTSGFLRLYNDRLGAIHVALPPSEEQGAILAGLAGELSGANTAISRLEREIELLREYRTRLVADVVTGKLDVREAAARLPDDALLDTIDDDADPGDETEAADEEAAV